MKKILFYYPSNKRTVSLETAILELRNLGYEVLLLTIDKESDLHEQLRKEGIKCYSANIYCSNSIRFYQKNICYLISFCKQNRIDSLFSHLQTSNLISVIAQFFIQADVFAFRHHFKFNKDHFGIPIKVNKNEMIGDKIINRLAKRIIVPSKGVYDGILNHEKINKEKLQIIPYLYDFSKYGSPNLENVKKIQKRFPARLRIIMVSRLIPFKRHMMIFSVIRQLVNRDYDIKLIVLDDGPEKKNLQKYIDDYHLENHIFLIGFRRDFLDYMKACDLIIHPSLTEASNSVIKEIGLMEKAVAVCKDVGDFDEYIIDKENGFLMDLINPMDDAKTIIDFLYLHKSVIPTMGRKLRIAVIEKFSTNSNTISKYSQLLSGLNAR